jgi:hypothetical protein
MGNALALRANRPTLGLPPTIAPQTNGDLDNNLAQLYAELGEGLP